MKLYSILFFAIFALSLKTEFGTSAEQLMEQSDTSSIESAVMRLTALNDRVKRLRNKLTSELDNTL